MKDLQIKKLYYSISEVSKMLGLEQYVLRYWETEFEQLRPQKNRAGNRIYTDRDIEVVRQIKKLTRDEKYTIAGAQQVLGSVTGGNGTPDGESGTLAGEEQQLAVRETRHAKNDELAGTLLSVRSVLSDILQKLGKE